MWKIVSKSEERIKEKSLWISEDDRKGVLKRSSIGNSERVPRITSTIAGGILARSQKKVFEWTPKKILGKESRRKSRNRKSSHKEIPKEFPLKSQKKELPEDFWENLQRNCGWNHGNSNSLVTFGKNPHKNSERLHTITTEETPGGTPKGFFFCRNSKSNSRINYEGALGKTLKCIPERTSKSFLFQESFWEFLIFGKELWRRSRRNDERKFQRVCMLLVPCPGRFLENISGGALGDFQKNVYENNSSK